MDSVTRPTRLEDYVLTFLNTRKDTAWFHANIYHKVKKTYTDIQSSQQNPDTDDLTSHVSNDSSQINQLTILKVSHNLSFKDDYYRRSLTDSWEMRLRR